MWIEIIRWVSLILLWIALTMNVIAFVKTQRVARQLRKSLRNTEELYKKLKQIWNRLSENSENKEGDGNYENN